MKPISVVVVDDQEVDRYIVKRRLSKSEHFGTIFESKTGDAFLEDFCSEQPVVEVDDPPLLILMDINMPGRNGFETVEELQRIMNEGRGPKSVVIMMFTTSDYPLDREKAMQLDPVKGYIVKPLDDNSVEEILKLYRS